MSEVYCYVEYEDGLVVERIVKSVRAANVFLGKARRSYDLKNPIKRAGWELLDGVYRNTFRTRNSTQG